MTLHHLETAIKVLYILELVALMVKIWDQNAKKHCQKKNFQIHTRNFPPRGNIKIFLA